MKALAAVRQHSIEKRRHRRRRVWLSAVLILPDAEVPAFFRDISCKGAMIESAAKLVQGGKLMVLRKGIETPATVAWVRAPFLGIIFDQPFSEKDLVEYSLPRAPLRQMLKVHGPRRPRRRADNEAPQ